LAIRSALSVPAIIVPHCADIAETLNDEPAGRPRRVQILATAPREGARQCGSLYVIQPKRGRIYA